MSKEPRHDGSREKDQDENVLELGCERVPCRLASRRFQFVRPVDRKPAVHFNVRETVEAAGQAAEGGVYCEGVPGS